MPEELARRRSAVRASRHRSGRRSYPADHVTAARMQRVGPVDVARVFLQEDQSSDALFARSSSRRPRHHCWTTAMILFSIVPLLIGLRARSGTPPDRGPQARVDLCGPAGLASLALPYVAGARGADLRQFWVCSRTCRPRTSARFPRWPRTCGAGVAQAELTKSVSLSPPPVEGLERLIRLVVHAADVALANRRRARPGRCRS